MTKRIGVRFAAVKAALPNASNLTGETAAYIAARLRAFRERRRQRERMSMIAIELSDTDIADLAAWRSLVEIQITSPERE